MKLPILKYTGEDTGREANLPNSIFNIQLSNQALYLDIKNILASKRQGTHSSKERSAIVGSTRKIRKQKGTGNARAGSISSPIFRGGARAFGPKPRNYGFKLNKKVKKLSRKSALTYKAKNNNIIILEELAFDTPKTKSYLNMLYNLKVRDLKTLIVLQEPNQNTLLSSRNLNYSQVTTVDFLNSYHITSANKLILTEKALDKIIKTLS